MGVEDWPSPAKIPWRKAPEEELLEACAWYPKRYHRVGMLLNRWRVRAGRATLDVQKAKIRSNKQISFIENANVGCVSFDVALRLMELYGVERSRGLLELVDAFDADVEAYRRKGPQGQGGTYPLMRPKMNSKWTEDGALWWQRGVRGREAGIGRRGPQRKRRLKVRRIRYPGRRDERA